MRSFRNFYIAKFRIRPASIGLTLLVFLVIFFLSCDEVKRHNVLTFFFDGVPPLEPEMFQEGLVDQNSLESGQVGQKPAWYSHEPTRDCSNCHSKRKRRSFSPQTYLIAPIPKLCYKCHDDFTSSASFVHGPVAVGQCTLCHNPHRTKIEHLLIAPEPGLCYRCHDVNTIELIPAHLSKQLSSCTDCHNPHASSIKALLKPNSIGTNEGNEQSSTIEQIQQSDSQVNKELHEQNNEKPVTTVPAQKSITLSGVLGETSRLIELGELEQARTYLEKYENSTSFNVEQKRQIARVLKMIDSVIVKNQKELQNNKKAKETKDLYYKSMAFYRTGQLTQAREGFTQVLNSGLIPEPMAKTIRGYITDIDNSMVQNNQSKK